MPKINPRSCWYCDGVVHFDGQGLGDCDFCTEAYHINEFLERENQKPSSVAEKAAIASGEYSAEEIPDLPQAPNGDF